MARPLKPNTHATTSPWALRRIMALQRHAIYVDTGLVTYQPILPDGRLGDVAIEELTGSAWANCIAHTLNQWEIPGQFIGIEHPKAST